jgi:hypothetical protein
LKEKPYVAAARKRYVNESWSFRQDLMQRFVHLETFVETGTFVGGGIAQALDLGFRRVHSIENQPELFRQAQARFSDDDRVTLWHGNSQEVFPDVLKKLGSPALIFLDAHSFTDEDDCSLLGELKHIASQHLRHTLLLDDMDVVLAQRDWGRLVPLTQLMEMSFDLAETHSIRVVDGKIRQQSQWLLTPRERP